MNENATARATKPTAGDLLDMLAMAVRMLQVEAEGNRGRGEINKAEPVEKFCVNAVRLIKLYQE